MTKFPSPHPGIINFFLTGKYSSADDVLFPSPHPGIINFFSIDFTTLAVGALFPSPHPGIINFFRVLRIMPEDVLGFRPLIRGLSISSSPKSPEEAAAEVSVPSSGDYQFLHIRCITCRNLGVVSVPSSGDYQFLRKHGDGSTAGVQFPSPHPGIINFFLRLFIQGFLR